MADRRVPECKQKFYGLFFYNENQLLSIAARFRSDVWQSSLPDAVIAALEPFGHELPEPSPGGVLVSVPTVRGEDKGDPDFGICCIARFSSANRVV